MKIFLVDDHRLFRKGLKMLIETIPGYEVCAEASDGKEFLEKIRESRPDVVLLDIDLPGINGIDAARIALKEFPELKIITLTMFGEEEYFDQMVQAGAKGFLLKNSDLQELKSAIDTTTNGGTYYSQELMQMMLQRIRQQKVIKAVDTVFSEREQEILHLICQGCSNQVIGEKLFISKRTVEKHRASLLLKTNSRNTAELVIFAIKNQIVTP